MEMTILTLRFFCSGLGSKIRLGWLLGVVGIVIMLGSKCTFFALCVLDLVVLESLGLVGDCEC